MKILLGAGILAFTSSVAQAQEPAQTAPAAQAAPAAGAALNGDTPIETLMAKPETKALLLKYVPEIDGHGAYDAFKAMSLRQLQPLAGGIVTDEKIASLETDLKSVK